MKRKTIILLFIFSAVGILLGAHFLSTENEHDSHLRDGVLPEIPEEYAVTKVDIDDITLLKNEDAFFPFTTNNVNGVIVSIGKPDFEFTSMLSNLTSTQIISMDNFKEATKILQDKKHINQLLLAIHIQDNSRKNIIRLEDELEILLDSIPTNVRKGIVIFGSPYLLRNKHLYQQFDGIVFAYDNEKKIQNRTAQKICGALPIDGKFLFHINRELTKGKGIHLEALDRLAFVSPEEIGISSDSLKRLDVFLEKAIKDGVFPGCQVAFAYKGKVIYDKSFGNFTYDSTVNRVNNTDLYDLASLTKVLASTPALMMLQSKNKFSLDKTLFDYLPDLVNGTAYQNLTLRSIMAHQAGLAPYFPFYKKTIHNGVLDSTIYSSVPTEYFNRPVAKGMWINEHFRDSLMKTILENTLNKPGHYVYSDVGYYFIQRIIEKLAKQSEDKFVKEKIYHRLGLNRIGYRPLSFYPSKMIAPTENDQTFRHQLIQGYVHDQGAALMGGVGGHAGLFANATDVLAILQMYLNKGSYAGQRLIDSKVMDEFTKQQFSGNRRAAGFDRPGTNRTPDSWPISDLASDNSYGHTGFTGTFVWVDPDKEMVFVFLSNRVYPDAENWKISKQRIRIKAHRMAYEFLPQ